MTSGERFTVLMFFIGIVSAVLGWMLRRYFHAQDVRWAKVDQLVLDDATQAAERPAWASRMDRLEMAVSNLAEIVAANATAMSRHEGWHAHAVGG